jgi:hypothetical protein
VIAGIRAKAKLQHETDRKQSFDERRRIAVANQMFNAHPHPAIKEFEAVVAGLKAAAIVWVSEKAFGPAVTQVKQSTFTSNYLYWLNCNSTGTIHTLDFIVTFKAGSPLTTQRQHFSFPGGYGGGTGTPFGVPFWGGNPILGPAALTVLANGLPVGTYHFTVVA